MSIGAAGSGFRPIVDWRQVTFCFVAMDQIVNQAAKIHYMFGGQVTFPILYRAAVGGGGLVAAQHSQSPYSMFMNVAGLKMFLPSTPYDMKGLLKTAIRDNNPVISFESSRLMGRKGPVPEDDYTIPFGQADVKREGSDVTVVALAWLVHEALAAAEELAKEGISVEIVDPRTLVPLDAATIRNSVQKTGRLVIADEAGPTAGFSAEIAAIATEDAATFARLKAPVKRVCALAGADPLQPGPRKRMSSRTATGSSPGSARCSRAGGPPRRPEEIAPMDLRGAVALVTGGNGGLGQRICHALAKEGAHVAVMYAQSRDEAEGVARDLASQYQSNAAAFACDITDGAAVEGLVGEVLRRFGRLDILVNDAAYNKAIPFADLDNLTIEVWDKIIAVNLTGPMRLIKAVAPVMKAQGRGRIVNIASVAGVGPTGSSIAYAVSKAGLIHLTKCMAVALAPETLVNCVAPGLLEGTRATSNLRPEQIQNSAATSLLKKPADKEDCADMVVTLCRTETMTGQTIVIELRPLFPLTRAGSARPRLQGAAHAFGVVRDHGEVGRARADRVRRGPAPSRARCRSVCDSARRIPPGSARARGAMSAPGRPASSGRGPHPSAAARPGP